jgi:hypothetical protein
MFGHCFHPPILKWQLHQSTYDPTFKWPWAKDPITGKKSDLSLTKFVDDVEKVLIIPEGTAPSLSSKVDKSNASLDEYLSEYRFKQNKDKEKVVPVCLGKGSKKAMRTLLSTDSRMLLISKYLGVLHHFEQRWGPELSERIRLTKIAFASLGNFWWRPRVPWETKRLIFIQHCISTAVSGLASQIFPASAYFKLDSVLATLLRRCMHGKAHTIQDEGLSTEKHHQISNEQVFRTWQLAPMTTEMHVQRLKWWQRLVAKPERNTQVLAAMFGRCEFEHADQLDSAGQVLPHANPYAQQFANDVFSLTTLAPYEWIQECNCSITALFHEPTLKCKFLNCDFRLLRNASYTACIPPPEYSAPPCLDAALIPDESPDTYLSEWCPLLSSQILRQRPFDPPPCVLAPIPPLDCTMHCD